MISYHCDFCKKELKHLDIMEIEIGTHFATENTYEVCIECFKSVKEFIESKIPPNV